MEKQEFRDFCHREFTQRGFKKRKNVYYRKGKDVLCGIWLQKSIAEAYYVNIDYFIGEYDDVKTYPSKYDSDIDKRLTVLSKDTYNGKNFMGALIEYERYTEEEVKPYFDDAFDKIILPPLMEGKEYFAKNPEVYLFYLFPEEIERLRNKLNLSQELVERCNIVYEEYLARTNNDIYLPPVKKGIPT